MRTFLFSLLFLLFTTHLTAQEKWFTKNGKVSFDATAAKSPENIKAVNNAVACVLESNNGNLQFAVLMQGFVFEKALMQEHFNENYVESSKHPKATFKGSIVNFSTVKLNTNGNYPVTVKGAFTLHGETKTIETTGNINVNNGKLICTADFNIALADYKINIPALVANKIASQVKINLIATLLPLNK